jgi:hypothetical protein
MNEKIRELAEQADLRIVEHGGKRWEYYSHHDTIRGNISFDLEKFAELIVKECALVAWKHTPDEVDQDISGKIKEHFGVEE